jgi:hypothetical protein
METTEAIVPRRRRVVLTVYPTARAAAMVLALSLLWLFPRIGMTLAVAGARCRRGLFAL